MTNKQRRLIWGWAATAALLVAIAWFNWLAWIVAPIGAWAARPGAAVGEGAERLNWLAEEVPWLRVWLAVCALGFSAVTLYVVAARVNLVDLFGFKMFPIALLVFLAPIVIVNQRKRFEEYGEEADAI